MSNVVVKLVKDSFLDQHYAKALDCMKALRQQCVKVRKEIPIFFINEIKY